MTLEELLARGVPDRFAREIVAVAEAEKRGELPPDAMPEESLAELREELARKREEWMAQQVKFDVAVKQGMTGAPLVRMDQKLTRLQYEMHDLGDRVTEREGREQRDRTDADS